MKTLLAAAAAALIGAPAAALPSFELAGAPGSQVSAVRDLEAGGLFFDVEFEDGSCVSVFSGCNEPADFNFLTQTTLIDVMTALEAAFVDFTAIDGIPYTLDTTPEVVVGCGVGPGECRMLAPFTGTGFNFGFVEFDNNASGADPVFASGPADATIDRTPNLNITFARVTEVEAPASSTAVPLPGGAALLPLALAGFAAVRRR